MANKQEIEKATEFFREEVSKYESMINAKVYMPIPYIKKRLIKELSYIRLALTLLEQAGEKKHHIPFSERIGYSSPEKEQAGEGDGICYDSEVFHPVGKGDVPPSPCGEFNSMAELKRKWIEATQRIDDLAREKSRMSTYIREQADEIKRYREALEKIIQADKDLLTNHDSWGRAMNEMTEEVNDSLDNLFGAIKEAKTALEKEKR